MNTFQVYKYTFFLPEITPLHFLVTYVRLIYYELSHRIIDNLIAGQIWRTYEDYPDRWIFRVR
jgi:hypothetical protein